jgi:F-type H+-transporting ATPase subunit gamma
MASLREMRLRIRSVRNIAQVTRAMQTVSSSKVRRAQAAVLATRPYTLKALDVLHHLADHRNSIESPMLQPRKEVRSILVVLISGDRGLAGAYNASVVRQAFQQFGASPVPVRYLVVGRKGRDMLMRMGQSIAGEFSGLPVHPSYADVSAIGRLAVEEFLSGRADEVHVIYTEFINIIRQKAVSKQVLPVPSAAVAAEHAGPQPVYIFEPGQTQLLDQVIPRLVGVQIFEAILESLASEHAARMVTMRNATDNALELIGGLQMLYNKARQQSITSDLLDIAAGTEALTAQTGIHAG